MWTKEVSVEEACELMEEAISEKETGSHRWTLDKEFVIRDEESPTGLAGFMLEIPKTCENEGIMDVNYGPIKLYAMEEQEVVVKKYVKAVAKCK